MSDYKPKIKERTHARRLAPIMYSDYETKKLAVAS